VSRPVTSRPGSPTRPLGVALSSATELPERPAVEPFPPGHFYSPVPSLQEVRRRADLLFAPPPRALPGIDPNERVQLSMLEAFLPHYREQPFRREATPGLRYRFDNTAYAHSDALGLYCMLRHFRPRRVIEVGSGWSSCVTLDTDQLFLGGRTACTFIEPYPALLEELILPGDRARIEVLPVAAQDVPLDRFRALEAGDVLFIDSTHVSKVGSDVNYLFLDVLPALRPGVVVHVHDIFWPLEYPRAWIEDGRAWNEAYLLRAFLTFNAGYEILYCNSWMQHFHRERVLRDMPLCFENGGGSIWLRRLAGGAGGDSP